MENLIEEFFRIMNYYLTDFEKILLISSSTKMRTFAKAFIYKQKYVDSFKIIHLDYYDNFESIEVDPYIIKLVNNTTICGQKSSFKIPLKAKHVKLVITQKIINSILNYEIPSFVTYLIFGSDFDDLEKLIIPPSVNKLQFMNKILILNNIPSSVTKLIMHTPGAEIIKMPSTITRMKITAVTWDKDYLKYLLYISSSVTNLTFEYVYPTLAEYIPSTIKILKIRRLSRCYSPKLFPYIPTHITKILLCFDPSINIIEKISPTTELHYKKSIYDDKYYLYDGNHIDFLQY